MKETELMNFEEAYGEAVEIARYAQIADVDYETASRIVCGVAPGDLEIYKSEEF